MIISSPIFHIGPVGERMQVAWLQCGLWPEGSGEFKVQGSSLVLSTGEKTAVIDDVPSDVWPFLESGMLYGIHSDGRSIHQYTWRLLP